MNILIKERMIYVKMKLGTKVGLSIGALVLAVSAGVGYISLAYSSRALTLIIIVVITIIGIVIGGLIASAITKSIKKLKNMLTAMSEYDFTQTDDRINLLMKKGNDELADMAKDLHKMREKLMGSIKSINENSKSVAQSAGELNNIVEQSLASANDMSQVIEGISQGAVSQAKQTEEGANYIQSLNALVNDVQLYINELEKSINEIDQLKENGLEALNDLQDKNTLSENSVLKISTVIEETSQSAGDIKNASDMIKNISEQTNLLALNAAIEAARAGEAGRGFAVVADEIRELADQSGRFTGEIDRIIQNLAQKIETSVKAIQDVEAIMESQSASVNNTNEKFTGISDAIGSIKQVINDLGDAGVAMKEKSESTVAIIEDLSAISEQNAAGTQEAAASIEEQSVAMYNMAESSENLSDLAEVLKTEISKFKY